MASNMFHPEAESSFNYCNLLCWDTEQNKYMCKQHPTYSKMLYSLLISILHKLLPTKSGNVTTNIINLAAKCYAGD
jgi:hypothetical protein